MENLLREVFTQVLNTFPRKPKSPPVLPVENLVTTGNRAPVSAEPPSTRGDSTEPAPKGARNVQCWQGSWPTNNGELCQQPERIGEVEAGPSSLVPARDGHASELDGNNSLDPQSLMAFFSFDDFNAEYAAWRRQPEETSSHADSGYFSSLSGGGANDETGKGKEVAWDPFAGF